MSNKIVYMYISTVLFSVIILKTPLLRLGDLINLATIIIQ